ncbi:unnamed protein product [Adineta steineri]|uniref:Uncharacterized protein n=2 Tax=Adineta steineri TaxID=433720 RepID=A0A813ND68_9BILA|nr:unnamed protein product [Adineta steineri]CAF3734128.1 unnamed protein product [Adineta steineri]
MVEPEQKDNANNLEDTVRNLREENAKLLQLLRSQGLLFDQVDEKSNELSNITFDNSDINLTTNSINTTNQITHQHVNNHGPINQQNYSGQIIHGNQSNITPNFNTVIQTTSQPFVQNNSNTLVQNNTNLIQPINLVNFNNVSLDSLHSFFASQNNLVYLSQTSSSSSTTTTTTTTTSNINVNNESEQHQQQISIRPKPSIIPQHQEITSVLPKINENISRQLSSSSTSTNSETTNLLDNDLNHKQPRPIRPKPSSRTNSIQNYAPVVLNETKLLTNNVLTPSSLINNTNTSSTVSLLSPSTSFDEHHHVDLSPQLMQSKSVDLSVPLTNNLLSSTKKPIRNRKKPPIPATTTTTSSLLSSSSVTLPPTNQSLIPIAPNPGRPLAPAPLNVQRVVTTNKRSTTTTASNKKRNSKTVTHCHSDSIINPSPTNSFAESISGLMQNFDQELLASNFLSQSALPPPPTTNILSNDSSSNINLIRTLDNIDVRQIVNTTIQRTESSYQSMPTFDEFNDGLDTETNQTIHDYNVDNEQITSFMNEEDMRFVEMNFDENTFLKQFDLDDAGIKLNVNSEQNIFASLLTNNHHLNNPIEQSSSPLPLPQPPPPPIYPGSSLINNNVFTTVVPLGLQQHSSHNNNNIFTHKNTSACLPEEGVQLTARHIEPSQVATYESVKYQDILDDLVTVTDQDVLSHVQAAAAANDTTVISTDFSFALIEATNEIIKTEIQDVEETASTFVDLRYFYPIEQEQEMLQKQLEQCEHKEEPQSTVIHEEKFESEMNSSAESPKSDEDSAITDLASIIQINQIHLSSPIKETTPSIDYDAFLLPPPAPAPAPPPPQAPSLPPPLPLPSSLPPPPPPSPVPSSLLPPPSPLSSSLPLPPPPQPVASTTTTSMEFSSSFDQNSRKACIIFEPILSPMNSPSPANPPSPINPPPLMNPPSPMNPSSPMNSLRLTNMASPMHPPSSINSLPLMNSPSLIHPSSPTNLTSPMKISDNELVLDSGCLITSSVEKSNALNTNDIEELLNDTVDNPYEIIENQGHSLSSPSSTNLNVNNLDHLIDQIEEPPKEILEKNFLHYQQIYQENLKKKPKEQYSPIPSVKLKLNSIYPKHKKKRKTSPSPVPVCENIRPPLKIKIRTKLPSPPRPSSPLPPPPPSPPKEELSVPKLKIRKPIKKPKRKKSSIEDDLDREAKLSLKTEYAGLTRFEQSLAQLYRQQSSPDTRIPPTPGENEDLTTRPNKQDTPPIHEMKHNSIKSPENSRKKISHLLNYDDEPLNNNTFITPPPEIEANIQHQKISNDYQRSPKKVKKSKQSSVNNHKEHYSSSRKSEHFPPPPPPPPPSQQQQQQHHHQQQHQQQQQQQQQQQPSPMHIDPYAQPYHHFDARTAPFFNFPFPNPFMNPHPAPPSNHFHPNSMKYHYPTPGYPTHQQPFSYHPHLQRQQQYNSSNYMCKF